MLFILQIQQTAAVAPTLLSNSGSSIIRCWDNKLWLCVFRKEGKHQSGREMENEWHLSDCRFWKWICFTRSKTAHFYTSSSILWEPFQTFRVHVLRLGSWFSCWLFLLWDTLDCLCTVHQDESTKGVQKAQRRREMKTPGSVSRTVGYAVPCAKISSLYPTYLPVYLVQVLQKGHTCSSNSLKVLLGG